MIEATIGDLLDGALDDLDEAEHQVYVVRDGEEVFYVGRSKRPVARLSDHLGRPGWFQWGISELGRFVRCNLPAARSWGIEMLRPQECGPCEWVDTAEEQMIYELSPWLNAKGAQKASRWKQGDLRDLYEVPWSRISNEGIGLGYDDRCR